MKVYLAAAFHRKDEMKAISLRLKELGVECTSRWLDEKPMTPGTEVYERFLLDTAQMDMDDVYAADALVRFSDNLSTPTVPSSWCTASRMEETGMAQVWGKKIIIVGGKQSLFDRFKNRIHLDTVEDLYAYAWKQTYLETWEG